MTPHTALVLRSTAEIWSESTPAHRAFVPTLLAMAERQAERGPDQPDLFAGSGDLTVCLNGYEAAHALSSVVSPETMKAKGSHQ